METTILKSEITYPECGQKKRSNVSRILPIFYEGGNCKRHYPAKCVKLK